MVHNAPEGKIRAGLLEQIRLEGVPLLTDPGERQTCGEIDAGGGHTPEAQLPSNGGEGQDIIVLVQRLVGYKLLVFLPDGVVTALIDQKVALEGGLLVVDGHAGSEAGVTGLNIPKAVVDPDDDGPIAVDNIHIVLRFCRCAAVSDLWRK